MTFYSTEKGYIEEILPYLKDMSNLLKSKSKNDKVVRQIIGNNTYTLLETETELNLFVLVGNYYSKLLCSKEVKNENN